MIQGFFPRKNQKFRAFERYGQHAGHEAAGAPFTATKIGYKGTYVLAKNCRDEDDYKFLRNVWRFKLYG